MRLLQLLALLLFAWVDTTQAIASDSTAIDNSMINRQRHWFSPWATNDTQYSRSRFDADLLLMKPKTLADSNRAVEQFIAWRMKVSTPMDILSARIDSLAAVVKRLEAMIGALPRRSGH